MVCNVHLSFCKTRPFTSNLNQLSVSPRVWSEHAHGKQHQKNEYETSRNRNGYHSRFKPQVFVWIWLWGIFIDERHFNVPIAWKERNNLCIIVNNFKIVRSLYRCKQSWMTTQQVNLNLAKYQKVLQHQTLKRCLFDFKRIRKASISGTLITLFLEMPGPRASLHHHS